MRKNFTFAQLYNFIPFTNQIQAFSQPKNLFYPYGFKIITRQYDYYRLYCGGAYPFWANCLFYVFLSTRSRKNNSPTIL